MSIKRLLRIADFVLLNASSNKKPTPDFSQALVIPI